MLVPGDTLLFDFHAASVEEDESKRWGFRASVIAHTLPLDAPEMLHMYRDVTAVCGMIAVQLMKGEELSHSFLDARYLHAPWQCCALGTNPRECRDR